MASALQQPEVDPGDGFVSEEAGAWPNRRAPSEERQKQALNLQRENILSQRTSHPARRAALEAALAQIEGQIAGNRLRVGSATMRAFSVAVCRSSLAVKEQGVGLLHRGQQHPRNVHMRRAGSTAQTMTSATSSGVSGLMPL